MLFFDHPIIYQAFTESYVAIEEDGTTEMPSVPNPAFITRKLFYASDLVLGDESPEVNPAVEFDLAPPPPIIRRVPFYESEDDLGMRHLQVFGDGSMNELYFVPNIVRAVMDSPSFISDQVMGDEILEVVGAEFDMAPPAFVVRHCRFRSLESENRLFQLYDHS